MRVLRLVGAFLWLPANIVPATILLGWHPALVVLAAWFAAPVSWLLAKVAWVHRRPYRGTNPAEVWDCHDGAWARNPDGVTYRLLEDNADGSLQALPLGRVRELYGPISLIEPSG